MVIPTPAVTPTTPVIPTKFSPSRVVNPGFPRQPFNGDEREKRKRNKGDGESLQHVAVVGDHGHSWRGSLSRIRVLSEKDVGEEHRPSRPFATSHCLHLGRSRPRRRVRHIPDMYNISDKCQPVEWRSPEQERPACPYQPIPSIAAKRADPRVPPRLPTRTADGMVDFCLRMSIDPGMRPRLRNMTSNTGYVTIAAERDGRAMDPASVVKEMVNAPARTRLVRFEDTRTVKPRRVQ